ncbi:hypothetical protein [Streptomyces sp. NPDC018031]|uniref:hypothetical protein n=1 Tax=Streptomyces sp. NPDC018031 TaxID=3365033 RepID=UPI00379136ED
MSARSARPSIRPARPAPGGVETRLPWWGIALPALAFAALLLLMSGASNVHAAGRGGSWSQLLGSVQRTVLDQLP